VLKVKDKSQGQNAGIVVSHVNLCITELVSLGNSEVV